jgi:precorrin-6A/cobalt-precorrin-6A reductase
MLWLIGGTSESAMLARSMVESNVAAIVTVTTSAARRLYPTSSLLDVRVGRLTPAEIERFIHQAGITRILDASHPYAIEISHHAIAVSHQLGIPYLRFERLQEYTFSEKIIYLDSFETLISGDYLRDRRVLLATGAKSLHLFQNWQEKATLFARVLPSIESLQAALNAGFTPDRVLCIRPPLTPDFEMALWRQWDISLVVSKASGNPGGEDIKRQVAAKLNIPLIIIQRPAIVYPRQTSDFATAIEFFRG